MTRIRISDLENERSEIVELSDEAWLDAVEEAESNFELVKYLRRTFTVIRDDGRNCDQEILLM